jgi:hypothetical protein
VRCDTFQRVLRVPSLLALSIALAGLAAASPVQAAVPRDGNVFTPRTGAELLEAADTISAEGAPPSQASFRIRLAPHEYLIDRPIVLRTQLPATLEAITGGIGHPVIANSGAPGTLLVSSSGTGDDAVQALVPPLDDGIEFQLRGSSGDSFPVIDLRSGGQLVQAAVTVPETTPGATAVLMRPAQDPLAAAEPVSLQGARISSDATAPAVQAGAGSTIIDSLIDGGRPALRFTDAPFSEHRVELHRSILRPGLGAPATIQLQPGSGLHASLSSDVIGGLEDTPVLIDAQSPTAATAPTTTLLRESTLLGLPGTIAVRVNGATATAPEQVVLAGVLSLGSPKLLTCTGRRNVRPVVAVDGYSTDGTVDPSTTCSITAQGRATGDPRLRDVDNGDLSPRWGSPLIDRAPSAHAGLFDATTGLSSYDVFRQPRAQLGLVGPLASATPLDIGALEYQPTSPQNLDIDVEALGGGSARFTGSAEDVDDVEEAGMTFSWRLDDGTILAGRQVTRQFTTQPGGITLIVTDITGRAVEQWQPIDVYLAPAPVPAPAAPGAGATKTATQLLAVSPLTAASFESFFLISSRIKPSRKLATGYGKPRAGEARIELDLSRPRAVTLSVARIEGSKAEALPRATVKLRKLAGPLVVRVSARIGDEVLRPGKYKLTFAAVGPRLPAIEQRVVLVRVLKRGA